MLRLAHALRPDGIHWPERADGSGLASFKLEDLARVNGVRDGSAHEALSDVRATLGMARLLRQAQPRLWDYALKLRDKSHVAGLLAPLNAAPLLHVSGRYPGERLHTAVVLPLVTLEDRGREVVVADLADDPAEWLMLDAEAIAARVFTARANLPDGVRRIGLKTVRGNRAPMLVPWSHLRADDFARLGLDPARLQAHADVLRAAQPALAETMRRVFARAPDGPSADADQSLYGGGFLSDADERRRAAVRATPPARLHATAFGFRDARLDTLLLRYRARNWPETLSADELSSWRDYKRTRLLGTAGLGEQTLAEWRSELTRLRAERGHEPGVEALLDALGAWGDAVTGDLSASGERS
jgi:exodeoxyribonuclease-1